MVDRSSGEKKGRGSSSFVSITSIVERTQNSDYLDSLRSICHKIGRRCGARGPETADAERRPTCCATAQKFRRTRRRGGAGGRRTEPGGAQADAPVRFRGPGAAISHPRECKSHAAARPRGPRDAEALAEGAGTVAHTARSMGGEELGRGGAWEERVIPRCHPGSEAGCSSPPRSGARRATRPSSRRPPRRRRQRARAST